MENVKSEKPIRSISGIVYRTNKKNKEILAKDFANKCAYCDDHHTYCGGYNVFHVEHFAPKEKFKELEFTYDNLLYSYPYCNISKSNKWVGSNSTENIIGNKGFVDPCTTDYDIHLSRNQEGDIIFNTLLGKYMYVELKLFLKRHKIFCNLEKIRIKRNLLKEKIDEKKSKNENYSELDSIHKELCVIFCDYYDMLFQEDC